MCSYLFGVDNYDYQIGALSKVFYPIKSRKISIRAPTRAGKSMLVAEAVILWAIFRPGSKIGIIAPRYEQTQPVMDKVIFLLNSNPDFENEVMISSEGATKLERLQRTVSKKRITFKNGSLIEIKSANENSRGESILGFGYDLTCVDESGLIKPKPWTNIFRMLLENKKGVILEIGNPLYLNHFYNHHHDNSWEQIHITWEDCLREGRFTNEQVEEQRNELDPDMFRVMMEAEFPVNIENCVYLDDEILNSTEYLEIKEEDIIKYSIGVDVARGGKDISVITLLGLGNDNKIYFLNTWKLSTRDTMQVVGQASVIYDDLKSKNKEISLVVDEIGVGGGPIDRLIELGYQPIGFRAGNKPMRSNLYYNLKSETAYELKKTMKNDHIKNIPAKSNYAFEFRKITYEIRSDKSKKIIDPKDKSPDYFDSLLYAFYGINNQSSSEFIGLEW